MGDCVSWAQNRSLLRFVACAVILSFRVAAESGKPLEMDLWFLTGVAGFRSLENSALGSLNYQFAAIDADREYISFFEWEAGVVCQFCWEIYSGRSVLRALGSSQLLCDRKSSQDFLNQFVTP
jgi:hypothetical protein